MTATPADSASTTTSSYVNLQRTQSLLEERNWPAIVATSAENVTYVTGYDNWTIYTFKDLQAYGVITYDGKLAAILPIDALDYVAERPLPVHDIRVYGAYHIAVDPAGRFSPAEERLRVARDTLPCYPDAPTALAACLGELGCTRTDAVGVELRSLPASATSQLAEALAFLRIDDATDDLRWIRQIKTPREIERLRTAAEINETAFQTAITSSWQHPLSEADLESIFRSEVARRGAQPGHWETSVGTRAAGCFPASDATPRPNDLMRSDTGCRWRGYWSDTGRSFCFGKPSEKAQRIYAGLREGYDAGTTLLRPGVSPTEIFETTVATIRDHGIPDYTRHHVGHAIGLEMYETPLLRPRPQAPSIHSLGSPDDRIEVGMVVNFEVPFYELGFGGLQIEDTFVITEKGAELLTELPRDLVQLPLAGQ